ncbi:MAG: glutamate-5-semialdehyde dehydrogenase [Eubacterium sp.]|nr:glutamate-5-semialdehyde dehydrogenase [Eubacterium sp.]
MNLLELGKRAKQAAALLAKIDENTKNITLTSCADSLIQKSEYILAENEKDIENGRKKGMSEGLIDRLLLTEERLKAIAEGMKQVASLNDPIGEVSDMKKRPNGLLIGKKRVPLGVVGIIYEARPNVTSDAFALCFKTGNAVILRGGSDAINSNMAIVDVLRSTLASCGVTEDALQLISDASHETSTRFMKMNGYLDVLIPRGGAGLINSVIKNATVPVIETGTGNCHVFVDESANINMAVDIIINAKTQRIGVCNACESILIHESIADKILPLLGKRLSEHKVEMYADEKSRNYLDGAVAATEADWGREYLDLKVSIKSVSGIDEAIEHINKYNTGHSESIVTSSYENSQRFLNEVDAAAVYVNASTRFTDGFEFGFGAEIGISTQKLHARGPMGLEALTTTKYIIYGNGQIR